MSGPFSLVLWWWTLLVLIHLQFTSLGHTELHGNAIMITSTISVVLFSNVVRCLLLVLKWCHISKNRTICMIIYMTMPSINLSGKTILGIHNKYTVLTLMVVDEVVLFQVTILILVSAFFLNLCYFPFFFFHLFIFFKSFYWVLVSAFLLSLHFL